MRHDQCPECGIGLKNLNEDLWECPLCHGRFDSAELSKCEAAQAIEELERQLATMKRERDEKDELLFAYDQTRTPPNPAHVRLLEKLANAERERDEAHAACAAYKLELEWYGRKIAGGGPIVGYVKMAKAAEDRWYDSTLALCQSDNPGQPILDRMAKAEAENAELRTCLAMVATGEIDLHVHQDGSWYYEMQACGLSEQGGMYDHPADAAVAGLADLRKD